MATEHVKFERRYDHTFPNRSMLNYPAGWEGPVKQEVADAARAGGYLSEDGLPRNVAKLRAIAKAEEIELGDASTADEIVALIVAARAGRLPGNLPSDLAEPQALTPNLHVDGVHDSR
jgi:hypothetical protein